MAESNLARKFAKNAFFKTIGEIGIRLLSFIFIVMVARVLGDEQFGKINFAYSFALLFVVIVDFGFNPLLVRETARRPEQTAPLFYNLLLVKFGLAVLFGLGLIIGLQVVTNDHQVTIIVLWIAAFVLLNSFTEFICAVFHGHQKMELEAVAMVTQKAALLLIGLSAVSLGWGVIGVAQAYTWAGCGGLVTAIGLLFKAGMLNQPWKIDRSLIKDAVRQALPLTLTTLFINIYFRIDMTILAKLTGNEQVGWYAAAHKCIEVLMVIPSILVLAAFPGVAKLFHDNQAQLAKAGMKILRLLAMLGLPIAVGSSLVGVPLITLIFGQTFRPAGYALPYLAFALAFIFLNYALSYFLIAAHQQKINAVIAGSATLVSIAGNFWLIPRFGYLGAAGAALMTELFLFAAYYMMVNCRVFKINWSGSLFKLAAAVTAMALVVWPLKHYSPLISIPVGMAGYALALWLFKAVDADDVSLLKKVLRKKV